ncbi:MAG: cyanophycinase [Deltaproteobacteria bacterium]|nr:cyanophycinase [Deltaproteobacteria bacterium]MBP7289750.1 cyanophycinase [Nannocystaceae bacterium]
MHREVALLALLGIAATLGCAADPTSSSADASSSGAIDSTSDGADASSATTTAGVGDTTASSTGTTDDTADATTTQGVPDDCPPPPAELMRWSVGDAADADATPAGPALILMGGGPDVDAAFTWWQSWVDGGDVVVLRASGADGYNDYLFADIGGVDSVETLLVDTEALADDPYVVCRVAQAEAVFMAGGDQARYMTLWKDRGLAEAVMTAWDRGAVVGGTSAGLAVLGEFVFAAYNDTVDTDEALADPYNRYMTMDRGMFGLAPLGGVITDSHFHERDRMGRLVGFLARIVQDGWADDVLGLGVDEGTALLVGPDGTGTVVGDGSVYAVRSNGTPQVCAPGEPLAYADLERVRLVAGDTIALPGGETEVAGELLSAADGGLMPADPY